uniref:Putative membrane protein yuiD n=1 Tax=Anthurium amnicola TaxID=1678845 RepID=A0A1D1Y923_9ARAE
MLYSASPSTAATSSLAPASAPIWPQSNPTHKRFFRSRPSRCRPSPAASLRIGVAEIAELAQNKVLMSAALACAIGQLSKPFTSALNGNGIDLWAAIRSGGMPSSHSTGVIAATTCLGLERGFGDPIFGMSAVFAAFVMYDAQGVRREVGNHAKILNRIMKHQESLTLLQDKDTFVPEVTVNSKSLDPLVSLSEKANSGKASNTFSPSMCRTTIVGDDSSEKVKTIYRPLNESVGHTEIQVVAGALLGFVVSLAIEVIV